MDIRYRVDLKADEAGIDEFDGIIIPGGFAPDRLRRYPSVLKLVEEIIFEKGGVVASICHGGWVTISAGIMKGKRATGVSAIKDDLINAGAIYLDQEVVVDNNLNHLSSPKDLPAYLPAVILLSKK